MVAERRREKNSFEGGNDGQKILLDHGIILLCGIEFLGIKGKRKTLLCYNCTKLVIKSISLYAKDKVGLTKIKICLDAMTALICLKAWFCVVPQ